MEGGNWICKMHCFFSLKRFTLDIWKDLHWMLNENFYPRLLEVLNVSLACSSNILIILCNYFNEFYLSFSDSFVVLVFHFNFYPSFPNHRKVSSFNIFNLMCVKNELISTISSLMRTAKLCRILRVMVHKKISSILLILLLIYKIDWMFQGLCMSCWHFLSLESNMIRIVFNIFFTFAL